MGGKNTPNCSADATVMRRFLRNEKRAVTLRRLAT